MSDFIRRDGNDLIVETTLINNSGNGITSGLTVTASIQRMSDSNYWDIVSPDFDSGVEGSLHTLNHIREGLYAFTLVGGAENIERAYRIHLVITGDPQVNRDATFSDVIEVAAAPGDATLANQVLILSDTTQLLLDTIALAVQNTTINSKTTNLPADPASETNVNDNEAKLDTLISGQATLSSEHTGINDNINDGVSADITKIAGSPLVDGVPIIDFFQIILAYMTGKFRINQILVI